ncbi:uncharacterized protein LOC128851719 isoform X2 [Cuculus canorus]|uniref:uncharacterized protein LOC128851719 isoform X2 n=1 Tax=Cuculus canorus TaxID=55661 RepID=UPI0023AAF328|nr:uncharacterized protein LOC128851719 isoform X2 [Cuculus canorus]
MRLSPPFQESEKAASHGVGSPPALWGFVSQPGSGVRGGTMYGDDQHFQAMLEPFWNDQIWEDSDDDQKTMALSRLTTLRSKEQWKEEFRNVWAQHEMDCGKVSEEKVESGEPVGFQRQHRLSAEEDAAMAHMLPYLLANGVVVEGTSPYNIPVCLKRKDDGKTWRLILNCRAFKKATPAVEASESLNIKKLVTTLSPESKYFSKVDLSNASYAIPLAGGCSTKFAFTFRGRQYLFTRLPQGFHSTNSIIHRRVTEMLLRLAKRDRPWVVSYVDDILIAGKNQMETEARTTRVLKLIEETGFKAKFEKAQLVQPEVDYLKMTIGAKGRGILASRLETIKKAPRPRDVQGVRSLLGQFGFLRDHIPDYWKLARPLLNLTKAQVRWEWGAGQEQALRRLKDAVLRAPPLRFPDKSQPFVISLTTSKWTVGATLLQEDDCGQLVPVGHSSHILKNQKVSYLLQEKRCLAAIWAVQAFQTLTGSAPIIVQMPHSPWKYFLRGEVLGSHGTNLHPDRWTLLLVNGVKMAKRPQPERGLPSTVVPTAPPLRLLPSDVPLANVWFMEVCSKGFAATDLEERWLLGVAEDSSVPHVEMVALKHLLHHHRCSLPFYLYTSRSSLVKSLQNQSCEEWEMLAGFNKDLWLYILSWVNDNPGMLHIRCVEGDGIEKEWSRKVVWRASVISERIVGSREIWEPSKHEKQEIIAWCHNQLHKGVKKTLERVWQVASWEGDREQVARWVRRCLKCAAGRDGVGRMPSQREEGPWSLLQLGYISGLTKTAEGYCSLLVVEDEFSGWVEAFPMVSSAERKVEETDEVLHSEIFERYGTPCAIRVPPSPRFLRDAVSSGMKFSCKILKLGHKKPATAILQRLAWGAGKEWLKMLPLLLAGIRSIRVRRAALSPYQKICGFPLEMRWGDEVGSCPQGNILRWLQGLQETSYSTGLKPRRGAAQRGLLQGCRQNHGVMEVGQDL